MLEALAEALHCRPADLIMRNPLDEDAPWSLIETWERATPDKRRQITRVIEALDEGKDGTNG
jgi:hypothetical protein